MASPLLLNWGTDLTAAEREMLDDTLMLITMLTAIDRGYITRVRLDAKIKALEDKNKPKTGV